MKKIFYNCKIYTLDKNNPTAEAMLVNDESIVFVGSKKDVLNLKDDETELVDLGQKTILPAFFDANSHIFKNLDEKFKGLNLNKDAKKTDVNNYSYDSFENFEDYKKEFLSVQNKLINLGITTIQEFDLDDRGFTFFKKLSEENLLKVDVVGYVDMLSSKFVMDDNCKTYRKYRNHFRLGGYSIAIDGAIENKRAWNKHHYKNEKRYAGHSKITEEHLGFLIKTALDERKQLFVETNGELALDEFIRCFKEKSEKKEKEDLFRPVAKNCNFISKKQIKELKNLGISVSLNVGDLINHQEKIKLAIGKWRLKRIKPAKLVLKNDVNLLIHQSENENFDLKKLLNFCVFNKKNKSIFSKHNKLSIEEMLNNVITQSAFLSFEDAQKGTLESGKFANFVVLDGVNNFSEINKIKIEKTFNRGKEIF